MKKMNKIKIIKTTKAFKILIQVSHHDITSIINHKSYLFRFESFNFILNYYCLPSWMRVGLPWGQFQGLYRVDKFFTISTISFFCNLFPTTTAVLQAFIAHIAVNFGIR